MRETLFKGLFDTSSAGLIAPGDFLLCIGVSLALGIFLALVYTYKGNHTQSFVVTLALLPAAVCMVIMMVNGNVGAGVAVAGAFGLVRFRSVPGTAREIGAIFAAMSAGLATGMGYLGYAALFVLVMSCANLLCARCGLGAKRTASRDKTLHVTIPENLDYTNIFDDLFQEYTAAWELSNVKTTNMGSLFKLTYQITLSAPEKEKELIDKLRCRNGNLEIVLSRRENAVCEL
ncbi:MAG: DUF4956 domain-containing protein [Clostridium sp.]|nr:DUF4956 domain-containing protein [Clostridium sp.]